MVRRVALVFSLLMLPGALFAVAFLLVARIFARTPRGRLVIARMRRRTPAWASAPLELLQGKELPRQGELLSS